ncbi:hypothetical protein [Photobacterium kasasachensis]|uniref:hypothetical protein n=1 Tax=Photobacterium kasasachensis TaxID=2910240 RepID=UPI003D1396B4
MWFKNREQVEEAIRRLTCLAKYSGMSKKDVREDLVHQALIRLLEVKKFSKNETFTADMYAYCNLVIQRAKRDILEKSETAKLKSRSRYKKETSNWEKDNKKDKDKPTRYFQRRSNQDVLTVKAKQQPDLKPDELTETELIVYAKQVFPVLLKVIEELIAEERVVDPIKAEFLYLLITNNTTLTIPKLNESIGLNYSSPQTLFTRFCKKVEKIMANEGYSLEIGVNRHTLEVLETEAEG